jgi:hypothetical protein
MSIATPSTAVGVFSNSKNLLVWGHPSLLLGPSFWGQQDSGKVEATLSKSPDKEPTRSGFG